MTRARHTPQSADCKLLKFWEKNTKVENVEVEEVERVETVEAATGYNEVAVSRLSILLRVDAEFVHSGEESRAVHSQARSSTIGTTHAPLAHSKCPYDLIALLSFIFVSSTTFVIWRICSFSSGLFTFIQVGMRTLPYLSFGVLLAEPQATCPSSLSRRAQ